MNVLFLLNLLFLFIDSMDSNRIENFLDKDIVCFEETYKDNFIKNKINDNNFGYLLKESSVEYFYGAFCERFIISLDDKNKVTSVRLYFKEVLTCDFYELFQKDYGEPISILKIRCKKTTSEGWVTDDEFKQYLTQSEFELINCSLKDKPLYVIWRKDSFEIKIFLNKEQGSTIVTFKTLIN